MLDAGLEQIELFELGRSKEKSDDCKLVTLGLIINENGFPSTASFLRGISSKGIRWRG